MDQTQGAGHENMPTVLIDPSGEGAVWADESSANTCGSIWCFIKSREGQQSIGCGLAVGGAVVAVGHVGVVGAALFKGFGPAAEAAIAHDSAATIGSIATISGVGLSKGVPCL
jgi:hypothetical protein